MKIKEEELKTIKDQQQKLNELVHNIGLLESQKHGLLHDIAEVNKEIESFKSTLEETYGAIEVDLSDGSYKAIEDKEEEVPVAAI